MSTEAMERRLVAGAMVAVVDRLRDADTPAPVPAHEITRSPSGLPVGELRATLPHDPDKSAWSAIVEQTIDVRLVVRADGRGEYWREDFGEPSPGFDVSIDRVSPGRAVLRYTGPACTDLSALTLGFTVRGRTVTIDEATSSGGCLVSLHDAASLTGVTFDVGPLP